MKKIIVTLLAIICCFVLVSCNAGADNSSGNDSAPIPQTVSITFKQEGKADVVKTVEKGADLTDIPTPTQKTGYTIVWDRTDFTNITENITVTGVETLKTYTVTLNANGGKVSSQTIYITYGNEYTLIRPTFGSNEFVAWVYNGQTVDFSGDFWDIDEADDTIELVARWRYYTDNF